MTDPAYIMTAYIMTAYICLHHDSQTRPSVVSFLYPQPSSVRAVCALWVGCDAGGHLIAEVSIRCEGIDLKEDTLMRGGVE